MDHKFQFNFVTTCGSCHDSIQNVLNNCNQLAIKNIASSTSNDFSSATFSFEVQDDIRNREEILVLLKDILEGTGLEFEEVIIEEKALQYDEVVNIKPNKQQNKKRKLISHIIKGVIGLLAGAGIMALTLSGVAIPMIAMYVLVGGTSLLTIILGADSFKEAWKKLTKARRVTMDTLFVISSLTVIVVSIASLFVPWMPMMLEAGVLIFGFRHIGEAIKATIKEKVGRGLTFASMAAKKVLRKKEQCDEWEACITADIRADDIIRVKSNDYIPVDGTSLQETEVSTTEIDGNRIGFKRINAGDPIEAGMQVPGGIPFIEMRATKTAAKSSLESRDEAMKKTSRHKADIETLTNKISQYFIPGVLILAAAVGIIVGALFNPALAIQTAAALLVSACPCTLGFITPMAMKIGMSKAAKNHVQFRSTKDIETADNIDRVVFDLNGTLTVGTPEVKDDELPEDAFDEIAALEENSHHPIAEAVRLYAMTKSKGKAKVIIDDVDKSNNAGVKATINHKTCLIGNRQFLIDHHIIDEESEYPLKRELVAGEQAVYFVRDNQITGYLIVEDPLRPEAQFVIDELQQNMKKEVYICTGADIPTAKRYAEQLGIPHDRVFAKCGGKSDLDNPNAKISHIKILQQDNKRVAMIGDSGNDAHAIEFSNFGIAISTQPEEKGPLQKNNGAMIAEEKAGATITNSHLLGVLSTFAIAKETMRSIKANLMISLGYNLTILIAGTVLVALGFAINPAIGVALMILQTALILGNQLRIQKKKLDHIERYEATLHPEDTVSSTCLCFKSGLLQRKDTKHAMQPVKETPSSRHEAGSPHSRAQDAQLQASTSSQHEAPHIPRLTSSGSPLF